MESTNALKKQICKYLSIDYIAYLKNLEHLNE